jgi:hypothetical protein
MSNSTADTQSGHPLGRRIAGWIAVIISTIYSGLWALWNSVTGSPKYQVTPDKETPLWNPNSQIIYWWTKSEKNDSTVYVAIYNGMINTADKKFYPGSRAFRAIKEVAE